MDSLVIDTEEARPQEMKSNTSGRQVFENIYKWLAGFISLTEEEKKEAGLFIGDHHD